MELKMYSTDGWSRLEIDGNLYCEGHSKSDLYEQFILQMLADEFPLEFEWIDEDDWDERF